MPDRQPPHEPSADLHAAFSAGYERGAWDADVGPGVEPPDEAAYFAQDRQPPYVPRMNDRVTFAGTGRVVSVGGRFDRPPRVRLYLDGYGDVYLDVPLYLCRPESAPTDSAQTVVYGALARAEALAAGHADWMTVTRWPLDASQSDDPAHTDSA